MFNKVNIQTIKLTLLKTCFLLDLLRCSNKIIKHSTYLSNV